MKSKKLKIIIASLAVVLLAGGAATLAFLTDTTDLLTNVFQKGEKYTLTYHANTGSLIDDATKVKNLPEKQTEYGNKKDPVSFTVSSEVPTRPGMVFVKWTEGKEDNTTAHEGGEKWTVPLKPYDYDLYAQWNAGYTLIYDANGGSGTPAITAAGDEKVNGNVVTTVTDANTYTFSKLATQGEMKGPKEKDGTSDHRVFLGWSTRKDATEPEYTSDGKLAYDNKAKDYDKNKVEGFLSSVEIEAENNPDKTVTLYAVWATKYVLDYQYHPDMLAISDPKCGTVLPKTQTLVSTKTEHRFKLPEESDSNRPTRTGGYTWGWWGDNLNRFGYVETLPTTAPVNEGCYLFDETIKAIPKDAPTQTLYAYFQPPREATVLFDKNTSWMPASYNISGALDRNGDVYPMPNPCYGYTNEHEYIPWEDGVPTTIPKHSVTYNKGKEGEKTYTDRYVFKGWAYTPNAKEPEVLPGQKDFSINMVLNSKVTLYAVWESGHNYRLNFNYNGGGRTYFKKSDGNWGYYSSNEYIFYSSDDPGTKEVWRDNTPQEYFAESSFTWTKDFFSTRGVFATKGDDANGTYKFLGWSYKLQAPNVNPEELTVDFPVDVPGPKDKTNPNPLEPDTDSITGTMGLITKDVTFDEPDKTCTTPKTHDVRLYAVWQRSPKHNFALIFNRGGSSNSISNSNKYYPGYSGYMASVNLPEKTWTVEELSDVTVPRRDMDKATGSTYEFIGWTDEKTYNTLEDLGVGTEEDVKIHVGPDGKINEPVTKKEPAENPRLCDGGSHAYKYYPVFRKTARHKFKVSYDVNAPIEGATIETYMYQSDNGTDWTKKKVIKSGTPKADEVLASKVMEEKIEPLTVKEYKYDLLGKGMYATCVNTSPRSTSKYTFEGWSYKKYELGEWTEAEDGPLDFPVSVPEDWENPSGKGLLDADVVIKEADEDPQCSIDDNKGNEHARTLYGVWSGEPLHDFGLVFAGGTDATIVYGIADDWANNTTKTSNAKIAKGTTEFKGTGLGKKDTEGNETEELAYDLLNTYTVLSDTLNMPADENDPSYSKAFDFDAEFWQKKGIIVKATRKDSSNYRYEFNGWNTQPDQEEGNVAIDSTTGLITGTVTATDEEYPKCKSKTHYAVVYPAWKKTKIHNYQVIFYANGGNEIGRYMDDGTWELNKTSGMHTYTKTLNKSNIVGIMNSDNVPSSMGHTISVATSKEPVKTYTSHEWKTTDPDDKRLRVEAKRADSTEGGKKYKYTFAGWSEDPNGSVQYTVDDKSFLNETIKLDAPHDTEEDNCESYTHTKVLYAIWNREEIPPEPARHRFVLTFDLNDGTKIRVHNSSSGEWEDGTIPTFYAPANEEFELSSNRKEYKWPESTWTDNGLGGARRNSDTYWDYVFVGWSTQKLKPSPNPDTTKVDVAWSHDPNSANPGDGWIAADDVYSVCDEKDKEDAKVNHKTTLYAVWKQVPRTKSYTLRFKGNSDSAQRIPADRENEIETYDGTSKWNRHTFDLSGIEDPTNQSFVFAGWSEDQNASSGQYGNPYLGDDDEDRKEMTKHLKPIFPDYEDTPALAINVYESTRTLYAIWLYEYKLEYDANGDGAMNAPPHMHAYDKAGQKTTRLRDAVPTWEGHKFLGWSTDPKATDPTYQPNEQITMHDNGDLDDDSRVGRAHIKLYAVWGPAE